MVILIATTIIIVTIIVGSASSGTTSIKANIMITMLLNFMKGISKGLILF